jgi:hypothetical protein
MGNVLRFKMTKQAVQMHSTATEVGKMVGDRNSSLARALIRFDRKQIVMGVDE